MLAGVRTICCGAPGSGCEQVPTRLLLVCHSTVNYFRRRRAPAAAKRLLSTLEKNCFVRGPGAGPVFEVVGPAFSLAAALPLKQEYREAFVSWIGLLHVCG